MYTDFNMSDVEEKRKAIILHAYSCIDKPFWYGAKPTEAPNRFDCSSFTQYLYKTVDTSLPRTAIEQAEVGVKISISKNDSDLKVGDLLFFRGMLRHYSVQFPEGIGHVAIYVGNDELIQASGSAGKVIKTSLKESLKRKDFVIARRVLG